MSESVQYVTARRDGYVSCEGFRPPIYLTADEVDASPRFSYGCGSAHPFVEDGVAECGIDLCHGRSADDAETGAE